MPRNIEIKARIGGSVEALLQRAAGLANGPPERIEQDDTFYAVARGRLKLRRFAGDGSAELIHYDRPDTVAARASDYVRVAVPDADALHAALARGCGVAGRVRKLRWLLLVGQTRVHIDQVDGLGDFIELEVVLRDGQGDAEGSATAEALMAALGLAAAERIGGAYVDLLTGADAAGAGGAAAGADQTPRQPGAAGSASATKP